jgi:heptosyltransferase-1
VVDHVHLVGAKQWGRKPFSPETWADIRRVRRELREQHYDVCVDLQGAVRSAMIGRWAGAARMIGEQAPREAAAKWLFKERVATHGRHVIEQALEVSGAIAGETLTYRPAQLPRDSRAEAWCDGWLATNFPGEDFVLLNPGAGWGAKRWPAARYGEVAATLASIGYGVAVNAGPAEGALAAAVVAASGPATNAEVVAVSPSLSELIALTRRAALLIAGDTGPLHLANALGRPVVGIFGPTDPARNGPYGSAFRILRHPASRRDHTRRNDPETGLLTISPRDVLEAALELLAESKVSRPQSGEEMGNNGD